MNELPETEDDNDTLPPIAGKHYESPRTSYNTARDNPQDVLRPGADDHKKWKSLEDKGNVVHHDRGHK
jgi:hypothetical protein